MHITMPPVCRTCGRVMDRVAEIAPLRSDPGLLAFLCSHCGASDSILVHTGSLDRRVDHASTGANVEFRVIPGARH